MWLKVSFTPGALPHPSPAPYLFITKMEIQCLKEVSVISVSIFRNKWFPFWRIWMFGLDFTVETPGKRPQPHRQTTGWLWRWVLVSLPFCQLSEIWLKPLLYPAGYLGKTIATFNSDREGWRRGRGLDWARGKMTGMMRRLTSACVSASHLCGSWMGTDRQSCLF